MKSMKYKRILPLLLTIFVVSVCANYHIPTAKKPVPSFMPSIVNEQSPFDDDDSSKLRKH